MIHHVRQLRLPGTTLMQQNQILLTNYKWLEKHNAQGNTAVWNGTDCLKRQPLYVVYIATCYFLDSGCWRDDSAGLQLLVVLLAGEQHLLTLKWFANSKFYPCCLANKFLRLQAVYLHLNWLWQSDCLCEMQTTHKLILLMNLNYGMLLGRCKCFYSTGSINTCFQNSAELPPCVDAWAKTDM